MGIVREWRHIFHVVVAGELDERGGRGGGGRDGRGVHPSLGGLGEVGRMDWVVKRSKIGFGVVGAQGGVYFWKCLAERYSRESGFG